MSANGPLQDEADLGARRGVRLSLSRTLTLGLSLLFLASLGTSLWIAIDAAQRNTFDLEREISELTVEAVIREVDTHLGAAQTQVEFLSGIVARGDIDIGDERRLSDVMIGALAAAPQVSGIALVRADYSVLRAGRRGDELLTIRGNWAHRTDIREAMQNSATLAEARWRAISWIEDFEAPHIVVAEPIRRDNQLLGLMFSVVSVSALSGFLDDFDKANGTHSFILYGREQVLAHPSFVAGYSGLSEDKPLPFLADVGDEVLAAIWGEVIDDMAYLLADSPISGHVVRGREDDYIYLYKEAEIFGQQPWLLGVYFRGHEVDLPLRRLLLAAALGILILVLAIICGLLLARSIVRPLRRLAAASRSVQRLELESVEPMRGSLFSELDVAIKAFESMLAGLKGFETYVPKNLVLRLVRSGEPSVRSAERQVTVLFTDIVDFTAIGARLSPTQLAALLNAHFTLLAEAIEEEEGTVDKYIGDSIMAFWGAPTDQPDHAARACRAAQGMARRLRAENVRRGGAGEEPLGLRIGIHSGLAIVGNVGAPGRVNYTLIGDTVNIAQRLEALGKEVAPEADVIALLSAETKAALDAGLEAKALGRFDLRGREEPLDVYRLDLSDSAAER
ncbi:MAG: adenylate/guanylate cyclase domain-containing protein [Alphaproteobacteria bacterium]|nr:adenylate/guanylate cyclase domain-containing protein [Alphaproteobacteria bacterium]